MKQRGDTIVEVLFAMVVIGISLAAAFGIANRSIQISRASQERTEAQKIAETQIELIKLVLSSDSLSNGIKEPITNNSAQNFCLVRDNAGAISKTNKAAPDSKCLSFKQLDGGIDYSVNINTERYTKPGNPLKQYIITVEWDRVGTSSSEKGTLKMYYRPGYILTMYSYDLSYESSVFNKEVYS